MAMPAGRLALFGKCAGCAVSIVDKLKGAASQLGKDALAGAISGITGGGNGAGANPENVSRDNVVVGQGAKGQALPAVENGQVGVPRQGVLAGYPTWAVAVGGVSAALLAVAVVAYVVKS